MKKIEERIRVIVVYFLIILLLPVTIIALSEAAKAEKDALETEYNRLKPIALDVIDDLNLFLNNCQSQISPHISFDFAYDLYQELRDRDFDGALDVINTYVEFEGQCLTDYNLLKDKMNEDIDDFKAITNDVIDFIKREKNNMAYSDIYPFLTDNLDIAIEMAKVVDNFVAILEDSRFAGMDFEAIVREEFASQVDRLFEIRDYAIDRIDSELNTKLDNVLASGMTNGEKIEEMLRLIGVAEDMRVDMINFHNDLQASISQSQLKQFVTNEKNQAVSDIDEIILKAKRKLILEIGKANLESHLGTTAATTLIKEVYGVDTSGNNVKVQNNYVIIENMFNIPGLVENVTSVNFGTISFTGLVGGKIATGSKMIVTDGEALIEYTFIVKGDLLKRGQSDISDLTRLIDHVLGTNTLTGIQQLAGDLNNDNEEDISDIVKLIDLILGLFGGN